MVIGSVMGSNMDNNDIIVPPHLNAEVYRTDTTGTLTQSHWDYIRYHPDGTLLIGCSELTGRYWDGSVIITKPESGNEISTSTKKAITTNSGTADGLFIDSSKVLLCEDSGALSIWSCSDDAWRLWLCDITVAEHDDAILAIDCLEPDNMYVTAGADGNIKVWDINEMIAVRNYNAAHSMAINAVAVKPSSFSTFATVSSDQYVSLWDHDTFKPVCDLLKNDCGVRCAQWLDENKLIFGDEAGIMKLVDIRNPEAAFKLAEFPAAVHRVAIQSKYNNIAVCCDNKMVTVCDISQESNLRVIYQNRTIHTNFVRGLAWDVSGKNILHSVGYDGVLRTHNVVNNDS